MSREQAVEQLWQRRQRSKLVRLTIVLAVIATTWAWMFSDITFADLFTEQRVKNWNRFWTKDAVPDAPNGFGAWLGEQMSAYGSTSFLWSASMRG